MPFCSDHFPGQYGRLCSMLSTSFFWLSPAADRPHQNEESTFNIWATVPLADLSYIIYSFLLDQLELKTSGWMLNSCSDICNCFLLFVQLTVQGISSLADIKVFWNPPIFSSTHRFYFFLNIIIIIIIIMLCCQNGYPWPSLDFSLSFIASSRSSGLHPVSSQSCCMYVRAGRPAFARQYVGIHRST